MAEPRPTWVTRRRLIQMGVAVPVSLLISSCRPEGSAESSTTSRSTSPPRTTPSTAPTTTTPAITTSSTSTPSTTTPSTTSPPDTGIGDAARGPTEASTPLLNPSAHGWPDASNTGVGAGARLEVVQGTLDVRNADIRLDDAVLASRPASGSNVWGPVTLSPDRTVIDAADIRGRLRQSSALPVYVDRSRITAPDHVTSAIYPVDTRDAGVVDGGKATTYLTECTIHAGRGDAASAGGWVSFERCDISGGEDMIQLGHSTRIVDSYLHDLERREGSHNDVFQMGGGIGAVVRHCTLLAARRVPDGQGVEFPDGWYDPMNAVLMIGNFAGAVGDVVIEDSLLDGGNYTINDNWSTTHPVDNLVVRGCRFGQHFRYGPRDVQGPAWTWENNVWDDTGEAV